MWRRRDSVEVCPLHHSMKVWCALYHYPHAAFPLTYLFPLFVSVSGPTRSIPT